jgi:hypothetical protein
MEFNEKQETHDIVVPENLGKIKYNIYKTKNTY